MRTQGARPGGRGTPAAPRGPQGLGPVSSLARGGWEDTSALEGGGLSGAICRGGGSVLHPRRGPGGRKTHAAGQGLTSTGPQCSVGFTPVWGCPSVREDEPPPAGHCWRPWVSGAPGSGLPPAGCSRLCLPRGLCGGAGTARPQLPPPGVTALSPPACSLCAPTVPPHP